MYHKHSMQLTHAAAPSSDLTQIFIKYSAVKCNVRCTVTDEWITVIEISQVAKGL